MLTQSPNLSAFHQQIFSLAVSHIEIIFASLDVRTIFFEKIPIPIFQHILASDALEMQEYNVWEFAFGFACHKTRVSKEAVEAHFKFRSKVASEHNSSELHSLVSEEQLKQLKNNLTPLLPAIKFSLMEDDQYSRIVEILNFFLPTRRSIELQRFHAQSKKTRLLDLHRLNRRRREPILNIKRPEEDSNPLSNIIDKVELWKQIKTWIVESNGIKDCRSTSDVKLNLLFRASEHEFTSSAFHENCDNKGPTIVIVKSDDEHLFGGVNFAHWESTIYSWSGTTSNFLFALVDGRHRTTAEKFLYLDKDGELNASFNGSSLGPTFGSSPHDLIIYNKANTGASYSRMPQSYRGVGASNTALAGKCKFLLAEYEVFSILKR